MSNLKGLSMSELIHRHNELANQLGGPNVTEFKNLAAARAAVETLEKKLENPMNDTTNTTTEAGNAIGAEAGDKSKYASTDKRGPNQGVGAFAKDLIATGLDNKAVLEAVKTKFPAAKTTVACIAYYRSAVKNGGTVKRKGASPEELRAKAQALLDQAAAAEAAATAKAEAAAQAAAEAAPAA
jgi:hypothetical protein